MKRKKWNVPNGYNSFEVIGDDTVILGNYHEMGEPTESPKLPMTYGELQHNLLTGIPVYADIELSYGAVTGPVTIIQAIRYILGDDGISRVIVFWNHPDFDNNQIDRIEIDKLYTKSEEQ